MHNATVTRKSIAGMILALLATTVVRGGWIGATSGTTNDNAHNYTNTVNWADGVIDDILPNTFTGKTTFYFTGAHATGPAGMTLNYLGYEHTFQKVGAVPQTLTLNGDFSFNGDDKSVILSYINLDLGGGTRIFNNSSNSLYRWYGDIFNGNIVKEGTGRFAVYGTKNFQGPLIVNGGSFYTQQSTVLNYEGPTYINNGSMGFYVDGSAPYTSPIVISALTGNATLFSQDMRTGQNRIGDAADIVLASGGSGNIQTTFDHRISAAGNDAVEDIGRFVLRSGQSKMIHGVHENRANIFIRLNADALVRENGSTLMIIHPQNYGDTATASYPAVGMRREVAGINQCGNQIFFDTPPETRGGPVNRGTDAPVVPFILGVNTVSNNHGQAVNTLMSYDAAGGLRAMRIREDLLGNPSEFVSSFAEAAADGKDNVRVTSTLYYSNQELAANAVLLSAGALNLQANSRLILGSGLLAFSDGGNISGVDSSVIDAGDSEGIVFNGGAKTIGACLAGSGGYTFSTFNSTLTLTGTNSYSGQTTLVSGTLHAYRKSATPHNVAFPDDGFVLLHPGGTLRIGDSTTTDYRTHEVIGSFGGCGRVQLGYISDATPEKRRGLAIGEGATVEPGFVTLDGGTISPGMPGEMGTLSVTTEANAAGAGIPVKLTNGVIEVDIAGAGVCDVLSTMTNVNINAGGNLVLDVDVNGFNPVVGQEWTIITSESGPITDGNGGRLFDAITDNSDRVSFSAAIAPDGKAVVLVAVPDHSGSVIVVR